eukprot:CAMPEP_0194040588 /NCGR_PEP_ID=MMETSP0009_2-20130614/12553_1 /TAXON_ID=210454 /ORGANISM="Grammatophora oceanica, Strain CCMP 410" /LENGTH=335 /DNA_ID=CAMNT_0038683773 /DNA_START=68 /DNA_END=1075 /DNA_ORIENTATION=-
MFSRIAIILLATVGAVSGVVNSIPAEDLGLTFMEYLEDAAAEIAMSDTAINHERSMNRVLQRVHGGGAARVSRNKGRGGGKKGSSGPYPAPAPAPSPMTSPTGPMPGPGKGGKKGGPYAPYASPVFGPGPESPSGPMPGPGKGGKKGGPYAPYASPSGGKGGGGNGNCPCPKVEFVLPFIQLTANATILVSTGSSQFDLGTVYLFNDFLFNATDDSTVLTALLGTFVTGTCTRVQQAEDRGAGEFLAAVGACHFTYTITLDDGGEVAFTASGELADEVGGTLSITGGTGGLIGAEGEVNIVPVYETGAAFPELDIFADVLYYVAEAVIFVDDNSS